ncbi:MAG: hypothetical protein R3F08_01205 [Dokdonella sp.]|nr:hypothetical protein [Dokdonella sp.]MCB1571365.1 hypothetical protein [Xanthomonadales bacterium]MCB1573513.1 hypothetical protein [Xanthomonadales bacterium]MCB1577582.1 hypothetical protein [Xanthomonadales bacterium]
MIAAKRRKSIPVLAAVMATLLFSSAATAREISVQEAMEMIQRDTHAKVLSVQTLRIGKRKIYRFKVLTPGGQVRVIEIKADQ